MMMLQERNSFVFISTSEAAIARMKQASEFLSLEPVYYASLKLFLDDDRLRPRTLLVDLRDLSADQIKLLPKIKRLLAKTQVVGLLEKVEDKKSDFFMQHYLTTETLSTFAFEFFLFQRNFCEFYEISPTDLFPETIVYFNAYHFLPLNRKYLPLIHENFNLSEKRHKRTAPLQALYIFRGDSSAYVQYIEKYFDQFKVGLKKRSKAKIYQLLVEWRDLHYSYMLEMREIDSCVSIRPDFSIWLDDLLNYLANAEDAWNLIFDLSRFSCFEVDSSLVELVVSSYLSRNLGGDEADKIVDLRLLLSLCRFRADSLLFKRWHLGQNLTADEKEKWSAYPDRLQDYKLSPDFPADVKENLGLYQQKFLKLSDTAPESGLLIYTYLGELIVSVLRRMTDQEFKKEDFSDSVIVKCKADARLSEAWLEELRQFLKK